MKTKFKLILLAVSALAAVACTLGVDDTETPTGRKHTTHFEAVTEGATATKVYADKDAMKVLWNVDDRLTIFNRSTINEQFNFTGADGDSHGAFAYKSSGTGQTIALDTVFAVYPYNQSMEIKRHNQGYYYIITTLPSEQHYKANSFGSGANTMTAISVNDYLEFKNLCGYLSLRLYGEKVSVSRITIKGNNSEMIAGPAYIRFDQRGLPEVNPKYLKTSEITLVCDPPVELGATAATYTDFWFVIPPTTFSKGFTVTVTDDSGKVFEKTTTKPLTVTRNTLDWMIPLEVVPTYDPAPMVVCTFNIRKANNSDTYPDGSSAAWKDRKASVKKFLDAVKPDLVGLQEILKEQSDWLASYSDEYGYFDVSRDSDIGVSVSVQDGSHEGVGVLYRKDRFELVSKDFFWLDEVFQAMPDAHKDAEGKTVYGSWDSGNRRITLSVVLRDKKHGNSLVYFFPSHYDNKSEEARSKGSELMVNRMKSLCHADDLKEADAAVFHVGDFNTAYDSGLLDYLNANLYYARTTAVGPDIDTGTYNGFKYMNKEYIMDHIYYGGKAVTPVRYWVDRTDYGVPFISDHYPVLFQWAYSPSTPGE